MEEPGPTDIQPLRSKTPRRGRRDTSAERGLTEAREAHWRALATVATLEEDIEWWGQNRRHCLVQPEESHAPYFKYNPPWRGPASEEDEEAVPDFNLEAPPELGLEVNCFLQGLAESLGEEDRKTSSPEPPVEDLESWVTWRDLVHDMSDWWQELTQVPGANDHEKLAQEVQAFFKLPWQISKHHCVQNYHQAPPAPLCIHWKSFLPPPDSTFAC